MAIVSVRIMMFYNWNGLILVCDEFIEFILIEIILIEFILIELYNIHDLCRNLNIE